MIWSLAVLATSIAVRLLLNSTPLAPKGGTPFGVNSGSCVQTAPAPPPGPVLQMMPWKESETYKLPALSKVSAFKPELPVTVINTEDAPVTGFTLNALPAPKSNTIRSPVTGLKPSPRVWAVEPAIAMLRISWPSGLNTKRRLGPGTCPWALKPNVVT